MGIMRKPKESLGYERLRKEVNRKVHEELARMKVDLMKEKDIGVSFLNSDKELNGTMFSQDLVHLNIVGSRNLGDRLTEWVKATRLLQKTRQVTWEVVRE